MLGLTPLAKIVAIAMIGLPLSMYSIYLTIEITDRIIAKEIISGLELGCVKVCNVMFSINMCISFSMSACISLPLTYAIIQLMLTL